MVYVSEYTAEKTPLESIKFISGAERGDIWYLVTAIKQLLRVVRMNSSFQVCCGDDDVYMDVIIMRIVY